jgi:hypothetical protein
MESNREAMRIDPTDEDPKFNYEQAKRKWKEVLDALKKQQEEQKKQQNQDQQNQDQQDQKQQGQNNQDPQDPKQDEQKQQGQQDQQPQDQKEQQGGQEDQSSSGTAEAQPQEVRVGEMTPEDVERLLNSLPKENADDMRRFMMPPGSARLRVDKDW